ncbi:MAG: hypothetical protein JWN85_2549 [Gammaproteobacteria bacterium]|nr:hypothetical protein [Gammaproteobacteria bacterium]
MPDRGRLARTRSSRALKLQWTRSPKARQATCRGRLLAPETKRPPEGGRWLGCRSLPGDQFTVTGMNNVVIVLVPGDVTVTVILPWPAVVPVVRVEVKF